MPRNPYEAKWHEDHNRLESTAFAELATEALLKTLEEVFASEARLTLKLCGSAAGQALPARRPEIRRQLLNSTDCRVREYRSDTWSEAGARVLAVELHPDRLRRFPTNCVTFLSALTASVELTLEQLLPLIPKIVDKLREIEPRRVPARGTLARG